MADEENEQMARLGAAFGSGAAKLGKKAAQSEAGRSAGRAAISGAAEGVKQDLTHRYLDGEDGEVASSPTKPPEPKPQPKLSRHPARHPSPSPSPSSTIHSQSHTHTHTTTAPQHREARPPKPSHIGRFKPHSGKPQPSHHELRLRRQSSHKDKVFKYSLSKEANWNERLRVQALYNYRAERPCDLEFRKGQIFEVLTRTDSQFDWWEGRLDSRVGIFPANYVKIM